MTDNFMFKIALIITIMGLLGMIFFTGDIEPRKIKIKDINRGMLDEDVSLEGVVDSVKKSSRTNTYFIDIIDGTGKISIIIFEGTVTDLEKNNINIPQLLHRGIKVTGNVEEYKGKLELILKDGSSLKILS